MIIDVGDILLTPCGEEKVLAVDWAAESIRTRSGTWDCEDLEEIAPPDVDDVEDLERWLRVRAQIIPRLGVQNRMVECSCKCSNCYRVDMWLPVPGTNKIKDFRSSHFRNNSQCECDRKGCSCRS